MPKELKLESLLNLVYIGPENQLNAHGVRLSWFDETSSHFDLSFQLKPLPQSFQCLDTCLFHQI